MGPSLRQAEMTRPAIKFPATIAKAFALAMVLGFCPFVGYASQVSAALNLKVNLQTNTNTDAVLCRNTSGVNAYGANATVICSTSAFVDISPGSTRAPLLPMHGGAFRFVTQVFWNGELVDTVDSDPSSGTFTTWRVVNLTNRNFLEMTVGW